MNETTSVLPGMTARMALESPHHPAMIMDGVVLDYAGLHGLVLNCVAALRSAGIRKGDRVGYLGLNSIDYVILLQAALRMGVVTVSINWRLVAREIAYIVADADLAMLITESGRLAVAPENVPVVLVDSPHAGNPGFRTWIESHEPDASVADIDLNDGAVQLYTSGTTGHPKGAILTHGSLTASTRQGQLIGEHWAATMPEDVALIAMPQFHIGGTGWTIQVLSAGASGVLLGKPEIADIIDAVEKHGITKMFAVPAVLNMILSHPRAATANLASMRAMLYGASPIPLDVLKRSMKMFPNAEFVQMYGATETSGTIVYLPPEDHSVDGTPRMAGCGKPYPEVRLRIVDGEGTDLPVGQVGEVIVQSPLVMGGYHNLPDAGASAFFGDWYRTGDAGYLDPDGYLYLYDRVKDMIVSGAENIYPAEVENILHEHPDVQDCAVIGVPDAKWGEAVKAVVVRSVGSVLDEAALIAFARQHIAGFKVPKSVDFVDALPRNPSGKILKRDLRKPYWPEGVRHIS